MKMRDTYLNRLPPELFYEIFSYLRCSEIFQSFYSVSDYINNVIDNYNYHLLDFSSENIGKNQFDLICLHLNPNRIFGLKIGETRYNLFQRYFINLHRNESLSHLRFLWITETMSFDGEIREWCFLKINFNELLSFRFDRLNNRLFQEPLNCTFTNLSRLVGGSSYQFYHLAKYTPMHLTFLHMFFSSISHARMLIHPNANHLRSLGISIECSLSNIHEYVSLFKDYHWTNLIQFTLNLKSMGLKFKLKETFTFQLLIILDINNVPFEAIKEILSPMTTLKSLTLVFNEQISIHNDLFDGYQWELFLSVSMINLKKFNLKLPVDEQSGNELNSCLDRFQSLWWLNEKKWCIVYLYELKAFITIEEFFPEIFDNSTSHLFDLMNNSQLFYSHITEMKLNLVAFNQLDKFVLKVDNDRPCFSHIKRLTLNGYISMDVLNKLRNNIDTKSIEYFQLLSKSDTLPGFAQLIMDMRSLSSLQIRCKDVIQLFSLIHSPLVSIRRLVLIDDEGKPSKRLYFQLCHLFPRLTHLTIKYHSRKVVGYLLHKLIYLEEICFNVRKIDDIPDHRWITQYTRLTNNSFESMIFDIHDYKRLFVLWINQEKNIEQSSHFKCPIQ